MQYAKHGASNEHHVKGDNPFPPVIGRAPAYTAQDIVGRLCSQRTLQAYIQLTAHEDPSTFCTQQLSSVAVLKLHHFKGFFLPRHWTFASVLVEFHETTVGLFF